MEKLASRRPRKICRWTLWTRPRIKKAMLVNHVKIIFHFACNLLTGKYGKGSRSWPHNVRQVQHQALWSRLMTDKVKICKDLILGSWKRNSCSWFEVVIGGGRTSRAPFDDWRPGQRKQMLPRCNSGNASSSEYLVLNERWGVFCFWLLAASFGI